MAADDRGMLGADRLEEHVRLCAAISPTWLSYPAQYQCQTCRDKDRRPERAPVRLV